MRHDIFLVRQSVPIDFVITDGNRHLHLPSTRSTSPTTIQSVSLEIVICYKIFIHDISNFWEAFSDFSISIWVCYLALPAGVLQSPIYGNQKE